jgi:hypothetical protein
MTEPSSPPARRAFIQLLGGGLVLAALPLASGCSSGMPAAAVQAWQPNDEPDLRRHMLAHALLAPNPHNRQPWLADLRRDGEITLVCDAGRLLPETDPHGRQILIGCGAFIELAVLAAAERGVRVQVQAFPAGEPPADTLPGGRVVARLRLLADASTPRDPLFQQVRRRRTHKGAYDNDLVLADAQWQALKDDGRGPALQLGAVADADTRGRLRALTRRAYEIECTTARTWLESAHLMRIGPQAVAQHRDGISILGGMPRLMHGVGLFDPFEVPVAGQASLQRVMDRFDAFETGSGYLWIASSGNGRQAQLDAGRSFVRMQLRAADLGLSLHPLSQALQEFAEMHAAWLEVHRLLGLDPARQRLQMLSRVGRPLQPAQPSPRRELATLLQV